MRTSQILALAETFPSAATIICFPPEYYDDLCNIIQRLPIGSSVNPRVPTRGGCKYYLRIGKDNGTYSRWFGYDDSPYPIELQHYSYTPSPIIIHTTRKSL